MSETKLRDVIAGALVDCAALDDPLAIAAEIADTVIRRLQQAQAIELDDGTLFVRRQVLDAGRTLASYLYATNNPGSLPQHVRDAMRAFEG